MSCTARVHWELGDPDAVAEGLLDGSCEMRSATDQVRRC